MVFSAIPILSILLLISNSPFKPAYAAPASQELSARQSFPILSTTQISTFKPFAFFAASAYCDDPVKFLNWSCGATCDANPTFQPVASGDGNDLQFWFVGFDPVLQTVVVGHQGSDPTKLKSILTDLNIHSESLDPDLFPGISSEIKVHKGFAGQHAKAAIHVLAAVQIALRKGGVNHVTLVGHSLGAALTLLDSVYLPLHLPNVTFRTIGYGMPRVGNHAFADYVDAHTDLTHINNKRDFIPILPGHFLGFSHPQGEVHIQRDQSWISCPGQDNPDARCTVGDVKNIFVGNIRDHDGPYGGVTMQC